MFSFDLMGFGLMNTPNKLIQPVHDILGSPTGLQNTYKRRDLGSSLGAGDTVWNFSSHYLLIKSYRAKQFKHWNIYIRCPTYHQSRYHFHRAKRDSYLPRRLDFSLLWGSNAQTDFTTELLRVPHDFHVAVHHDSNRALVKENVRNRRWVIFN